jgi:hypothetical protein
MSQDLEASEGALESRAKTPFWHLAPAWLSSLLVHLATAVLGVLFVRAVPPKGIEAETVRPAAIVLARRTASATQYFADEPENTSPSAASASSNSAASRPAGGDPLFSDASPPPIAGVKLPELPGVLASGDGLVVVPQPGTGRGKPRILPGVGDAEILAADAAIPREAVPMGPTAKLALFGSAEAEGRSFVFVIDRSQSMGGDGLGAISAAAKELAAQLTALSPEQKVQAVAYNQTPVYFSGRGLLAADEANKKTLIRWVSDIAAFGPTEHERGLLAALKLRPEVIFLLTDGGDPEMHAGQFRVIREEAAGRTSIHCLHFGRGPADPDTFLRRLAAENRGSYVYIDMNTR